MSVTEEVLDADEAYARDFKLGHLYAAVAQARDPGLYGCATYGRTVLWLKTGEAHIIRNAGGIATEDALRSLIISHHLLGTQEFIVINHTDCGMATFKDEALRKQLEQKTGSYPVVPAHFYDFDDLEENVRIQVERIKSHPWIPRHIPVRGFVYDVQTGRLHEVVEEATRKVG